MAFATQPNVTVTDTWSLVTTGGPNVTIQVLPGAYSGAYIAVGTALPASTNFDGNVILPVGGRDSWAITGLASENIYARAMNGAQPVTLSVIKG